MKQTERSRRKKIGTELTSQWVRRAQEAAPWNDVSNTQARSESNSNSACRLLSVQVIKLTVMSFHCWTKRNEKCERARTYPRHRSYSSELKLFSLVNARDSPCRASGVGTVIENGSTGGRVDDTYRWTFDLNSPVWAMSERLFHFSPTKPFSDCCFGVADDFASP